MSIAFVQQIGGGSTSAGASFTSTATNFTAGNLLVAIAWFSTSSSSPTGINTPSGWTIASAFQADGGANGGGAAFYMPNNPGGSQSWTWTKTGGTTQAWAYIICEFSGVDTSSGLDLAVTKSVTGASSSPTHNPGAASGTTQAGDLLISLMGVSNSTTTITYSADTVNAVPAAASWTVLTKEISGTSGGTPRAQATGIYQILGPSTTQASPDGSITSSASVSGGVWFMTFKPSVSTPGTLAPNAVNATLAVQPPTLRTAGLSVTTQTQNGISGGPPGNGTTETDISYENSSGDGWRVGIIPAYGGALISPWYEIDAGVVSVTQTDLGTTSPDGLIHVLAQSTGAVFTGTEDPTFSATWSELDPVGTYVRRYYDSGTLNPSTGPALNYRVTVAIWPGDPGFLVQRIDIINPSGTAVTLASSDSLEIALIGGLEQIAQNGVNAWQPGNGKYASVGGTQTAWPVSLTTVNPDYVFITPQTGAGLSLGMVAVRHVGLETTGGSSLQLQYLQNTNRLKLKVQETLTSFPGSTTYTLYYLQAIRRSLTGADADSIAADYINPGSPTTTDGTFTSFNYDEGCYQFASSSGSSLSTTLPISSPVTKRWNPRIKVTGWTSSSAPAVSLNGTSLTSDSDYLAYVDTTNQILYLVFLAGFVATSPGAGELQNGTLVLGSPTQTISPSVVNMTMAVEAPAFTKGAVTALPATPAATFTVHAPSFTRGAVTTHPAVVNATLATHAPAFIKGAVTALPAVLAATFTVKTPSLVGGGAPSQTLFPSTATASFSVKAPTLPVAGTVDLRPSVGALSFDTAAPTLSSGARLQPNAVSSSFSVKAPAFSKGLGRVLPAPAVMRFGTAAPSWLGGFVVDPVRPPVTVVLLQPGKAGVELVSSANNVIGQEGKDEVR